MGIPSTEKGLPRLGLIHVWGALSIQSTDLNLELTD